MQWLSNFSMVIRSNVTTLCERFEDPERMLHQLLIDMESELERVRDTVAGAIADEIQLDNSVQRVRAEMEKWNERAVQSMHRGDEATAKSALEQKHQTQERLDGLVQEHDSQKHQTEKLRQSVLDLEQKIRQARQKQTLLLARLARADSTQRINRAFDQATNKSAFAQFSKLERRAERSEAIADAYDRLDGRDPEQEELDRRFAEQEREKRVNEELEALKARIQETTD